MGLSDEFGTFSPRGAVADLIRDDGLSALIDVAVVYDLFAWLV